LARLDKLRQRAADHAELLRARAGLEGAEREYDRVAESVMRTIQSLGLESAATANGMLDQLGKAIARLKDRSALEQSEQSAQHALANAKQALEREQTELATFFAESGLEFGDHAGLQRLVKDRARFDALNAEATKFREWRALAREQLQSWRGWQPTEAAQLAPRTAAAREASAEVERLLGEIRDIEGDVERRRAHEVIEAARANLRDAEDALEAVRERVFDDLAATVLLDEVESDLESGASLPVLARAIDLFSAFTGGRHRLSLERHANGKASFRAIDALGPHELQQ
jgi:hypothetical protein